MNPKVLVALAILLVTLLVSFFSPATEPHRARLAEHITTLQGRLNTTSWNVDRRLPETKPAGTAVTAASTQQGAATQQGTAAQQQDAVSRSRGSGISMLPGNPINAATKLTVLETEQPETQARPAGRPRPHGKLAIVIALHAEPINEVVLFWSQMLALPKIAALSPYLHFVYQSDEADAHRVLDGLETLLQSGDFTQLSNVGREGRAYLHYIVSHYNYLPDQVLFSQAIPGNGMEIGDRISALLRPETGMLALAEVFATPCDDTKWPHDHADKMTTLMYQMYAMFEHELCPPTGFMAFYKGEMVVSRARILLRPADTYKMLLGLIEAPPQHFVHGMHNDKQFKDPSRPFFGHVLERSWNLLWNCTDLAKIEPCYACARQRLRNCVVDACMCMDEAILDAKPGRKRSSASRLF